MENEPKIHFLFFKRYIFYLLKWLHEMRQYIDIMHFLFFFGQKANGGMNYLARFPAFKNVSGLADVEAFKVKTMQPTFNPFGVVSQNCEKRPC